MKKPLALGLSLALALSLTAPALAAEEPANYDDQIMLIGELPIQEHGVPIPETFHGVVAVNGAELDLSGIPGAPAGYLPMRVLTEADNGYVEWYPEEQSAFFFLDNHRLSVNFQDLSVEVEFERVEGVAAYLDPAGYTFLPASLLQSLDGVAVDDHPELSSIRFDLTTSSSDPMVILANSILEAAQMAAGERADPADLEEYYGIRRENFDSIVAYLPMMIRADTVILGQVAEGRMEEAKADLRDRLAMIVQNFEHYLQAPYEMAQKGQVVESPDGRHVMLIISQDNDAAIALFNAAYAR